MEEILKKIKWVVNSEISSYEIERETGITRATIANMRKKKDNYDYPKMSLQNAIALEDYYNSIHESSQIFQDQGGFITFTSSLDSWLTKATLGDNVSDEMRIVINKLKDLALKDMDLLQELYTLYKETVSKGTKAIQGTKEDNYDIWRWNDSIIQCENNCA